MYLSYRIRAYAEIMNQEFTLLNAQIIQSLYLVRILCIVVGIPCKNPCILSVEEPVVGAGIDHWVVVIVCLNYVIIPIKRPEESESESCWIFLSLVGTSNCGIGGTIL